MNYGFSNYALVTPTPPEAIPAVPVTLGHTESIIPVLKDTTPILIDKAKAASVQSSITVDDGVTAPVEKGQQLGLLRVTAGDEAIAEIPLVAPETVAALTWWDVMGQMLRALCMA